MRTLIEIYASTLPLELALSLCVLLRLSRSTSINAHCVGSRDLYVLLSTRMRIIESLTSTRTIVNAYTSASIE